MFDQGVTLVLETDQGHSVVLTSTRMPPLSLEQVLSLGIRLQDKKNRHHQGSYRSASSLRTHRKFSYYGGHGSTSEDPKTFEYQYRRRPLYPLEGDAQYRPLGE